MIAKQIATTNKGNQPAGGPATNVTATSPTQATSVKVGEETVAFPLEVTTPANQTTVSTASVKVTGKTKAAAEVTVNDIELKADNKGNFTTSITLDEGENTIVVVANDTDGNFAEKELVVNYEPES